MTSAKLTFTPNKICPIIMAVIEVNMVTSLTVITIDNT
ncbi:hypothetical protein Clopa_0489 [Clostridium pasteurianum BC1]|uniref:Uncharacterized protein n=1 Tax=Clostridium pasteurianum BC1 TaxID=86416 RepID=R4JXL0_CLOPA|nr:hypothetical protein Clopa_0489 [Clostridium pasteurianum BC1]